MRAHRQRAASLLVGAAATFAFGVTVAGAAPGDLDRDFGRNGISFTSNGSEGRALTLQRNGRIVAVGNQGEFGGAIELDRYFSDGDLDPTFGNGGRATVLNVGDGYVYPATAGIDSEGRIVVAGSLAAYDSPSDIVLVRVLPGGDLDTSFGDQGVVVLDPGSHETAVARLEIRPNDSILVGGWSQSGQGSAAVVARVGEQGDLEPGYGDGGTAIVPLRGGVAAMDVDTRGSAILTGEFPGPRGIHIIRLTPGGELDESFSGDGRRSLDLGRREWGQTLAIGKRGRIFVGGSVVQRKPHGTSRTNLALARLKPSGALDRRFGGDGIVTTDMDRYDYASGLEPQADGKLVVSGIGDHYNLGYPQRWVVLRYRKSGRLDRSFSGNGVAFPRPRIFGSPPAMEMQPNAHILLLGWRWEDDASTEPFGFILARMRNDGRPRITSAKASASPALSAGQGPNLTRQAPPQ
jgi:uncharacterized delta-60 repeat protein